MKKLIALLAFAIIFTDGLAQTKSDVKATESNYSNWLFVQSDKAMQYRFKLVKKEGDIGFYQVQLKPILTIVYFANILPAWVIFLFLDIRIWIIRKT